MQTFDERLKETLQNEDVGSGLVDLFHDLRRDMLLELEVLFDKVDDGYVTNDYFKDQLTECVKLMDYALSMLRLIKKSL
jgi:hypothetical protein